MSDQIEVCPRCDSADIGSRVAGPNQCRNCGFDIDNPKRRPRKFGSNSASHGLAAELEMIGEGNE